MSEAMMSNDEKKLRRMKNLRRRMDTLERLLQSLNDPPAGQLRDIINRVAVEGRSVTNILQKLRGAVQGFDDWYKRYVGEMRNDELLRFFYDLRTQSLKEGEDSIIGGSYDTRKQRGTLIMKGQDFIFVGVNPDGTEYREFHPKPANAVAAFVGDEQGGSGWEVMNSDETKSNVYVKIRGLDPAIELHFSTPPKIHLGQLIEDTSARNLCTLYVSYLLKMVQDAEKYFGSL